MTAKLAAPERSVKVDFLTRVEGEGGLYVHVEGGELKTVRVDIYEPPRFFEAFLKGRHFTEVPDITARICGICPVAYQMGAVHALEAALGIEITPEIRALRRLLYCAEWIESHALHIYLLQAPDFLKYESAISLAKDHPKVVEQGLRLKKVGNHLLETLGGRAIHPVSACVGGFHHVPRREQLDRNIPDLEWALQASLDTVRLVSGFTFTHFEPDYEFASVWHPTDYPLNERRVVSSGGIDVEPADFEKAFLEEHVPHSTALHSVRADKGTSYFVGPLARLNLNAEKLLPISFSAFEQTGRPLPWRNPFHGVMARAIELVYACEESLRIIAEYKEPAEPKVAYQVRAGEGCAATEAPRGICYHRYKINDQGLVEFAKIVPPTAQNYRRMEDDLRLLLAPVVDKPDSEIASLAENLVRCYDPCISCSTHFLKLRIDRS